MKGMILFITILVCVGSTHAQLPHWQTGTHVRVFAVKDSFTPEERSLITAAIAAWQPLLPSVLTMEFAEEVDSPRLCPGCVTITRAPALQNLAGERGESELTPDADSGLTAYAIIRIDPHVRSGDELQRVVEHELGHALGLPHREKSIMAAKDSKRHPDAQDAAQLRLIYPSPVVRYSFHRTVEIGSLRRQSTFTFNDRGEQIETAIIGSDSKQFRSVPLFPVGVELDWAASKAINKYAVVWKDGKTLSVDGTGDEPLWFPVEASNGKTHVWFSDYKLFRTSVSVRELDQ